MRVGRHTPRVHIWPTRNPPSQAKNVALRLCRIHPANPSASPGGSRRTTPDQTPGSSTQANSANHITAVTWEFLDHGGPTLGRRAAMWAGCVVMSSCQPIARILLHGALTRELHNKPSPRSKPLDRRRPEPLAPDRGGYGSSPIGRCVPPGTDAEHPVTPGINFMAL